MVAIPLGPALAYAARGGWRGAMAPLMEVPIAAVAGPLLALCGSLVISFIRSFGLVDSELVAKLETSNAESGRLKHELEELRAPKLEICFGTQYPYGEQRVPGPDKSGEPYRIFRIGVRTCGNKTVDDPRVFISVVAPRPDTLFPPLFLQAMHDRPDKKTNELHPIDEPWYFDVVDQLANGAIRIPHTITGIPQNIPPDGYAVKIVASGRDVPSTERWFLISVPTPRQGNQDLQFTPLTSPPTPAPGP